MYPVPSDWATILSRSDTVLSAHVDILTNSNVVITLPVEQFKVVASRTAASRRTCTLVLTVTDESLIPQSMNDLLAPNGVEFRPWADVTPVNGSTISVPLGTFQLITTTIDDTGSDITLTLDGQDRSWAITQRKYLTPYVIPAATDVGSVVQTMVESAWAPAGSSVSPLAFNFTPTGLLTPDPSNVIQANKDPWTSATLLAASAGCELFFDTLGVCVMRPTPDPSTRAPDWYATVQYPSGLKGLQRAFTRQGVYSAFEVIGTGPTTVAVSGGTATKQAPIDAYVEDDDPSSPVYALGPFGVVPNIVRSTTVSTLAQGDAMAATLLAQQKGVWDQLTPNTLSNPALDIDDVIQVQGSRIAVNAPYVVDGFTLTWHFTGDMTITCRPVQNP